MKNLDPCTSEVGLPTVTAKAEPIADPNTPTPHITVNETPFNTKPEWAYIARYRRKAGNGVESIAKYGSTPEQAVERVRLAIIAWAVVGYVGLFTFGMAFSASIIFPPDVIFDTAARFWGSIL